MYNHRHHLYVVGVIVIGAFSDAICDAVEHVSGSCSSEKGDCNSDYDRNQQYVASIPRIIHHVIPPIPDSEMTLPDSTGERFPFLLLEKVAILRHQNPGWDLKFWHDTDISRMSEELLLPKKSREYMGRNLSWYFHKINPKYGASRGDLLRLAIIYTHGGVYFDTKSGPTSALDKWLPKSAFAYTKWPPHLVKQGWGKHQALVGTGLDSEIVNWFFAAPALHPMVEGILAYVLNQIVDPHPGTPTYGKEGVWELTGPVALTKGLVQTAEWKDKKLRKRMAKKVSSKHVQYEKFPRVISTHNRGGLHAERTAFTYRDYTEPILQMDPT